MGHAEYLDDAYLRLEEEGEIAAAYLEAMPNVSVYAVQSPEVKSLEEENEELKDRMVRTEERMRKLESILLDLKRTVEQLAT